MLGSGLGPGLMFGGGGGMPYIRCAGRKRAPADATPAICNKKAVSCQQSFAAAAAAAAVAPLADEL